MRSRKALITSLVLLTAALSATIPALAATRAVRVGDNWFVRSSGVPTVTVKRGDTVRWRWVGSASHNVTVRSGPARFKSRTQSSGTFSKRLTRRGTYRIICTIHGAGDQSMVRCGSVDERRGCGHRWRTHGHVIRPGLGRDDPTPWQEATRSLI